MKDDGGMPWWNDGRFRFDRNEWMRYSAAVLGAVVGMAVWMAGRPFTEDPWVDGLIGIGIVAVALSAVLGMGVALWGSAKNRVTLEDIKAGQNEIIRLLKDHLSKDDGRAGNPPDSLPPPPGGGDGGRGTDG